MNKKNALASILRFEQDESLSPQDAELLIGEALRGCGFPIQQNIKLRRNEAAYEVDIAFSATIEGNKQSIAAEIKHTKAPAGKDAVHRALAVQSAGDYDRVLLISRAGFSKDALFRATSFGVGRIDLLTPIELRRWVEKNAFQESKEQRTGEIIIRSAMREYAEWIARNPDKLDMVEWRDLERILREVFEGLGFETILTRPAKDGGFDLELRSFEGGARVVHLVEVKHWTAPSRPGGNVLKSFLEVVVSKSATRGLLLSSSGFTANVFSGISEVERQRVRLGDHTKLIALCQTYYKLGTEIWINPETLPQVLYEGTI